ncbi:MAG: PH domain-containing protein [Bacteroidota bacterium]
MDTSLSKDTVIQVRPSVIYSVLASLKFLLLSIVFFGLAVYFRSAPIPHLPSILSGIGLIILAIGVYKYFYLQCTIFIISHDQIKTMTGVFSRRIDFLEMYRIKDYIVTQSFLFRILNLMTFTLLSIDKNAQNKTIQMKGITVTKLPDHIRDLVQTARQRNRVFEVDNGTL